MRLSQISTEKAADVLCQLTPYVSNIAGDAELFGVLKNKIGKDSSMAEIFLHGSKIVSQIIPIVLKDHRGDVFNIVSIINEASVDDIKNQKFIDTLNQIKEILNDKDFADFFRSWRQAEQ